MATAQKVRSQSKQGQWSSIFPNEQVTETQSTLFVKKLLAVAVSSISYLRALFPENAFGDRCLEDVNLKILRDDSSCPEACRVIQWIRGCFAALEKKYLRSVLVGIYEDPDDPDTVIEEYSFKFSYGDGAGVDIYRNGAKITTSKSDSETKKATIRLLRTIVLLSQTLNPLPDDVMMTMKLNYYDDVTPEDYNPPGFKDCEHDTFTFKEEPMNIKVGDVSTQYHSFKLRIKTSNHDLQDAAEEQEMQDEELPIQNKVVDDEKPSTTSDETPAKKSTTMDEKSPTVDDDERPPIAQQSSEPPTPLSAVASKANTRTTTPASSVLQDDEEVVTKCPCGVDEDDGLMILCASCNTWQHATCFAILDPEKAPDTHYCVLCSKKDHLIECTDAILGNIEELTEIKANCLWRRTLVAVLETTRILAPNLSKRLGVAVVVATSLLKRLENEGFVTNGGKAKRFGKLVKKEVITGRGFDKYFKYIESEESEDVEMMTERASGMDIRSNKEPHENETTSGSGKKRKSGEVMSSKNKELRFEIADSQASQSPTSAAEMSAKKRRKGSISAEPMCV